MRKMILTCVLALSMIVLLSVGAAALDVYEAFEKETFEHEGTTLPYRIYVPDAPDGIKGRPLVLFLHGAGERGDDNEAQLKNAVQVFFDREDKLIHEAVVIAPQCPAENQWVDTPWADGNYSVTEIPESNELAATVVLVSEIANKYSCDPARIYVIGLSMGGFGTWDLLMRHSDIFAAGIPICGGADPEMAEIFMKTPVFTFHGTADTTVPYEGTYEMVDVIEDLGSRVVNLISYTNDGHGIWDKAAREEGLMEWLFAQTLWSAPADETEPADTVEDTADTAGESVADTSDVPGASDTSDVPAATDTRESEASDTQKSDGDNGGLPVGVIVAISAVVVIAVVALAVKLKKKK